MPNYFSMVEPRVAPDLWPGLREPEPTVERLSYDNIKKEWSQGSFRLQLLDRQHIWANQFHRTQQEANDKIEREP
jgi:hypothetical protein